MELALPPGEQAVQPYYMPGRHRPPATAPLGRAPGEILADYFGDGPRECSVLLVRPGRTPSRICAWCTSRAWAVLNLAPGSRTCQGKEGTAAFEADTGLPGP